MRHNAPETCPDEDVVGYKASTTGAKVARDLIAREGLRISDEVRAEISVFMREQLCKLVSGAQQGVGGMEEGKAGDGVVAPLCFTPAHLFHMLLASHIAVPARCAPREAGAALHGGGRHEAAGAL